MLLGAPIQAGLLAIWLLLIASIPAGIPSTLAFRTYQVVHGDAFVPVEWMAGALLDPPSPAASQSSVSEDDVKTVGREFELRRDVQQLNQQIVGQYSTSGSADPSLVQERDRAGDEALALDTAVSQILSRQIQDQLQAGALGVVFGRVVPPVNFRFTPLPRVLVISPRDRIVRVLTVTLRSDLTLGEAERIEDRVAALGYSTLVTPIGGLGTYPSMIPSSIDLQTSLRTIAHEWTHQYFALHPLGWRYALGIETDNNVIMMNETSANIIGNEIGGQVYQQYKDALPQEAEGGAAESTDTEFAQLMRETRQAVDQLLAAGKVDEAEHYMEQQRQYLADRGYYIRKLNQAYFAFYGSYADQPGFVSPVGEQLQQLRARSGSLGDFARRIAAMSSYADLLRAVGSP
ncbi:MAG: hypothetical protein M1370_07925 [Bacteroidetes bacterium]|nr:hypothetical protein [Bacteroidota bacterium]MCL5025466.1 hypothetical protein [Chloroflexota bacterium]